MKAPRGPRLDPRRTPEFAAELRARARAWLPSWALADGDRDFGSALLDIAARFSSEVAERLDRAGEKMQRGFLDWLAVRGQAARPARMPVVFALTETARDAVLTTAPVRMQADAGGASVIFETETDVRLVPGRLEIVVGVDADGDAVYLPPPGLSDLEPLEPLPVQWQLKSFAAAGATTLQVDPEAGLAEGLVLEAAGQQYRIVTVDNEIVTIDPPLTADLPAQTIVRKISAFAPFDGKTRNRQEHALYLGHAELLDIESAATLSVAGAQALRTSVTWQYWGKVGTEEEAAWRRLELAPDDEQDPGSVVLVKPKGALEPRNVGGRNSRWIRALTKHVPPSQQPFQAAELSIGINPFKCSDPTAFPPPGQTPSPAAEGMANSTPLVLESVFYPLGREPRQFDAFYLGCAEAFSKPGAQVQLHLQMADPSFESLATLRSGALAHWNFAGVAGDGHLYLLGFNPLTGQLSRGTRGPLRPPSPGPGGAAVAGTAIPLDRRPPYRAALWEDNLDLLVAVAAGDTVWIWRSVWATAESSGWQNFGTVGPVDDSTSRIAGIVHLADGQNGQLFALREGKLFARDLTNPNAGWKRVHTLDVNADPVELETIVAIGVQAQDGVGPGTMAEGLIGVGADETLYAVTFGDPLAGTCTELLDNIERSIAPAAIRRLDGRLIAVAVGNDPQDRQFHAARTGQGDLIVEASEDAPIPAISLVGRSIHANVVDGLLTFALCLQDGAQSTALAQWTPFYSPVESVPSITTIPNTIGIAGGSPTLLPTHVLVPATSSQVLVAPFDGDLLTFQTTPETAVIASSAAQQLVVGDSVAIPISTNGTTTYQLETVAAPGITRGAETLYAFAVGSVDEDFFVYRAAATAFSGAVDPQQLELLALDAADTTTTFNSMLLITTDNSTELYTVIAFDANTGIVELDRPLDVANQNAPPASVVYQVPESTGARMVPLLRLVPATTGNWQASLLGQAYLLFPGAEPSRQRGKAFLIDPDGKPMLVALGEHWTTAPADTGAGIEFLVDARIGTWTAQLGDPSANPALSWEYANGTGWWKLDPVHDETLNLKQTGNVRFTVPADLRPMDWAGRTNYWIRARLVGGDYGREIVTVTTKPTANAGETQQTIERSSEGIRAPSVVTLHIAYKLCKTVRPSFVLAQDSGSMRDQSDANRTRGAVVEAFVPLAVALGRLSGAAAAAETAEECPPPCHCPSGSESGTAASPAALAPAATPRLAAGRALFIGLDATPSGAPVNVLLLVDREAVHESFAPMRIDALVADRFVPVVANDTTRALGESGLLSMAFMVPPTPRELFGMENLTWLRLTPGGGGAAGDWQPALRGAYLNAVWASGAETLTRELLGSSEGAPNLTLFLARPPVVRDSLELRVREPLGEEERQALRQGDESRVLSDVDGLPGDWVLWNRVIDPGDEPSTARVYALDEAIGEVRFGDGRHGMIPPIGRDSIVAFSYRRTEIGGSESGDVPGNAITARTPLNLISPLESVEAVFAADRAAGGAPPESDERVVRFGTARLRHCNRAVTARDFEDLALESTPDIVQARCFVRTGRVRLVVVMRGADPSPDAAEVRELRRLLLAAAPASLGAPGALRIGGPSIRRLRIALKLRVATLDHAGAVSRAVQERIAALFDTATGGIDGQGWALGAQPGDEDIALAIIDTRRLESLAGVALREVLPDGAEHPWKDAVKRDELVMLDRDPVRLEFETVEVIS